MSRALDYRPAGGGGGNDPRLPDAGNSNEYLKSSAGSWVLDALTSADVGGLGSLATKSTIVNADVDAAAAIAESKLNLASDAAAGTASRRTLGTGATQACAGNDSRLSDTRTPTDGSVTLAKIVEAAKVRALAFGKAGSISATETDAADFLVPIPFDCTVLRMKVTCKTAPGGSMAVQLRKSTNSGSSFADVSGFVVTFSASAKIAVVDPSNADLSEGDILNFSASTGSGANLLVELVLIPR